MKLVVERTKRRGRPKLRLLDNINADGFEGIINTHEECAKQDKVEK